MLENTCYRYWQVPMAKVDRCKTAFVTPESLYEFNVMTFSEAVIQAVTGLSNIYTSTSERACALLAQPYLGSNLWQGQKLGELMWLVAA